MLHHQRTIHVALPALAHLYPTYAAEFLGCHALLVTAPGGGIELPTSVLTTAYRRLASDGDASRTEIARRLALFEVASSLEAAGHREQSTDMSLALGVWGTMVGRGTQSFRALATSKPRDDDPAEKLADLIRVLSHDLFVLAGALRDERCAGKDMRVEEVRAHMRANPQAFIKGMRPPPTTPRRGRARPPVLIPG